MDEGNAYYVLGATGLIEALANDYLSTLPESRSISWVCNHSRNTQLALYNGYIDLALAYERGQEELAHLEVGLLPQDAFSTITSFLPAPKATLLD